MWFIKRKEKRNNTSAANSTQPELQQDLSGAFDQDRNAESIQLVEGRFNAVEAADILISLINDKIRHHTIKTLDMKLPAPDREHSDKRIKELRAAKNRVKDLVIMSNKQGLQVEIDSNIEVKLVNPLPGNDTDFK